MDLIDRVIAREGGSRLTKDPDDPGGTTKFGLSQRAYPDEDIENLTYERARMLYERDYLLRPSIDKIQDPYLREHVFDFAVHSGPKQAIKALQRLLGQEEDGKLGNLTLAAVNAHAHAFQFYLAYMRERLVFLSRVIQKRPTSVKYLAGWTSRVLSI